MRGCIVTRRHHPSLQVDSLAAGAGLWQFTFKVIIDVYDPFIHHTIIISIIHHIIIDKQLLFP